MWQHRKGNAMNQQDLINLVKDMSLTEKVNQLLQVTSGFYIDDAILTGPIRERMVLQRKVLRRLEQ